MNTIDMPRRSAASITSPSRIEPPGCTTAMTPPFGSHLDTVREREKGVGGQDRPSGPVSGDAQREVDADHPVGLSRAHPDQRAILGEHNGIGLDVFARPPSEGKVAKLSLGRLPTGDRLPGGRVFANIVSRLHQRSSGDEPEIQTGGEAGLRVYPENAGPPTSPEYFQGALGIIRRNYDVVEYAPHGVRRLGGNWPVESDDASVSGHRVALERPLIRGRLVIVHR